MSSNEELSEDPIALSETPYESTALDTQKLEHRKGAFGAAQATCIYLYSLFFAMLAAFILDTDFRVIFVEKPHVSAILIALLLVPSFLLWGIIRAAFSVEYDKDTLSTIIKLVKETHPLS